MPFERCPGQDKRFWKAEDISESPCPHCGAAIEFWKDDPRRRCRRCGKVALNPRFDMGCAKWCKYAEQCLGAPNVGVVEESLCDALVEAMKRVFGPDERRIAHACAALCYAERVMEREGGDPLVVRASAVLHDVGIPAAEKKHGSSAGKYQEIEGPPIARDILRELGVDPDRTDHVCRIIGDHHSAKTMDTIEFRVLWDADQLVNLFDEPSGLSQENLRKAVEGNFRTATGREIARQLLAQRHPSG